MSYKTNLLISSLLVGSTFYVSPVSLAQTSGDETITLDTISVVGLRPVAKSDLTVSVTVLDQTDLAVRDSPFLADQLRAIPGLGVSRSGAVGGLTQVRIRGAEANQTLVLVDGIEVSDPVTGETDFGLWSGLDAGRIEVLRGEQSALYGSEAIGGVINIVTNKDTGIGALAEVGSRGSWRLDGRAGLELGNGYLVVSTANSITGGTDTSGLGGETDGSQQFSGGIRGGYEFENWQISGLARYSDSSVDFDEDLFDLVTFSSDGLLDNTASRTETEQFTVGGSIAGDALGLNHLLRANYHMTERETLNASFESITDGDRFEIAYSPSYILETNGATHTFSGLIEYEATDFANLNQSQGFNTLGLAAEYSLAFGAADLNGSIRFDENDGLFDNAVTWRVGGAYSFDALNGRIRGSVGQGVTNPAFTELFGFSPFGFIGNPDLQPEESLGWEIGWDQTFGPVTASLTYFSAELEDEITTVFNFIPPSTFTSSPINLEGDSERQGIEFSTQWQVTDQLRLSGQATWTESENDQGITEIRVPDWTGSLSASWQSKAGWRAGVALDLVGEQNDTDFGTFTTVVLPTYALLSASLDVPVTERIAITFRGENLTDSAAQDVFGFNRTGTAGFIGIRLR